MITESVKVDTVYIMLEFGYSVEEFHKKIKDYLATGFSIVKRTTNNYDIFVDRCEYNITYFTDRISKVFNIDDNFRVGFVKIICRAGLISPLTLARRLCNYVENGMIIVPNQSIGNHNYYAYVHCGEDYSFKSVFPLNPRHYQDIVDNEDPIKYSILYDVNIHFSNGDYIKMDMMKIKVQTNKSLDNVSKIVVDLGLYDKRYFIYNNASIEICDGGYYIVLNDTKDDSLSLLSFANNVTFHIEDVDTSDMTIASVEYLRRGSDKYETSWYNKTYKFI